MNGLALGLGLAGVALVALGVVYRRHMLPFLLWPLRPGPRNVLAWIIALGSAVTYLLWAWTIRGHVTCDFAGQWLMGRMIYMDEGHNLYRVGPQRLVLSGLRQPYPRPGYAKGEFSAAPNTFDLDGKLVSSYYGSDYDEMDRDILRKGRWGVGREPPAAVHGGLTVFAWMPACLAPQGLTTVFSTLPVHYQVTAWYPVVEGPLYPPTMGLVMLPFARLDPAAAQPLLLFIYLVLLFLTGWLVRDITGGRVRAGEAALVLLYFPNLYGGLMIGQNHILSLAVITAGWALWGRNRPWLAGFVWGLLAYKPVFAVALIWVPLVMRSWRMFAGMALCGGLFCLLTLPTLLPEEERALFEWNEAEQRWEWALTPARIDASLDPWRRWLQVGNNAADIYSQDTNWVWLSRDLLSVPRRQLWWDYRYFKAHFQLAFFQRDWDDPPDDGDAHWRMVAPASEWRDGLAWGLFGLVLGATVLPTAVAAFRRWRRGEPEPPTVYGPRAAFLLFGALLTTYHFIHYDLLVTGLPALLLLASADRMRWRNRVGLGIVLGLVLLCGLDMAMDTNRVFRIPFEQFLLLGLWGWAGWLTWAERTSGPAA